MWENAWRAHTTDALTATIILIHTPLQVLHLDHTFPMADRNHSGGILAKISGEGHTEGHTDLHHTVPVKIPVVALGVRVRIDLSLKEVRSGLMHADSKLTGIDNAKVWGPGE